MRLVIDVTGTPAPQGSKVGFAHKATGRVVMVESSKKVKPWRQDVKQAALDAREATGHETFTGPVSVGMSFYLPRPKHHYRTGRLAHKLRDNAPEWVATKPDLDKLQRSTLDALGEAGVWRDDSQVVDITARKTYAGTASTPGAYILIRTIEP